MDSVGDSQTGPLRLSVTMPGSASLGAFQAGAVSVVGEMVDELGDRGRRVCVDAVGGASAGSIVALFLAHCLVEGKSVPELMHRAWVEEVDVDLLRAGDRRAPLGFEELRAEIPDYLGDSGRPERRSEDPIALHIALTNLYGLTYSVETAESAVENISFADWARFDLRPGGGLEQLTEPAGRSPLDCALASASHPGAFGPAALDRTADRQEYLDNGITGLPESGTFWYTDGGLVESEPIGRVIEAARQRADGAAGTRLHLVVDPRSSGPSGEGTWTDPESSPTWLAGLRRSLSILPTQVLYEDLRGIAVVNERLAAIDEIVAALAEGMERVPDPVAELARRRGVEVDDDAAAALRSLLHQVFGLTDKEPVDVELVSPLEIARDRDAEIPELLAGDVIGAFGGFLSRDLRASDYSLGWAAARSWLPGGLERHGVSDEEISQVCERVDDHRFGRESDVEAVWGGFPELGPRARWRLARLAGRIGRILVGAAVPDTVKRPFNGLRPRDS